MTDRHRLRALPNPKQEAHRLAEQERHAHKPSGKPNKVVQHLLTIASYLFYAKPEEFYGKNYVTDELVTHSQLTARAISIASLVNAITNQPLLFFAFRDFSNPVAWAFSLTLNILIVRFTNDTGTAVAGRKRGNRFWAFSGAVGLIGMSVLQSAVAAFGTEAMLNGQKLSELKAIELINKQEENLEGFKPSTGYSELKKDHDASLAEYQTLDHNDPRWDSLHVHLYGAYGERNQNWCSLPEDQQPLARKLSCREVEEFKLQQEANQEWQQKRAMAQSLGDLVFLKRELPEIYQQHFTEDYTLKSGIETVRLAVSNLTEKVRTGDLAGAGFPIFFLLLSLITSTAACLMTFAHAARLDTQMSRNDDVGKAIRTYLDDLIAHADGNPTIDK